MEEEEEKGIIVLINLNKRLMNLYRLEREMSIKSDVIRNKEIDND